MSKFLLIGCDNLNALTGPIAKKTFDTEEGAAKHADTILSSQGNQNLKEVYIMEAVAVARRVSPPVEIVSTRDTAKVIPEVVGVKTSKVAYAA